MTKKLSSKLLSVILTIAICASAVFGCLITANAADVTDACYSWSDGSVSEDLTTATVNLTITAPDAPDVLSGGINEALFYLEGSGVVLADLYDDEGNEIPSVKVVSGVCVGGEFNADNYGISCENGGTYVEISAGEVAYNFSKIVLELTLGFKNIVSQGDTFDITISGLTMSNGYDDDNDYINFTGTAVNYTLKASCDHVYDVTAGTFVETNYVDGYHVYKDVPCTKCSEVNPYQVVPATELGEVLYWDGTVSAELSGSGTKADPYIISSVADLAYVTSSTITTECYYKVADGIDAFVLQSTAHSAILDLIDFEQTKAYVDSNKSTMTVWKNGGTFKGYFDGNGVEIYGMYSTDTNGGLFSIVSVGENSSSIKNISVKNSYVTGKNTSSALVGRATAGYSSEYSVAEANAKGYVEFEKVVLANNYIFNVWCNDGGNRLGVMLANADKYVNVKMDSCLVYGNHIEGYYKKDDNGNIVTTATVEGGLFGVLSKGHNYEKSKQDDGTYLYQNGIYSNSIILDCVPYAAAQDITGTVANHAFRPAFFTNVYTNCTSEHTPSTSAWFKWSDYDGKIILVDKSEVKGPNSADIVETLGGDWQVNPNGGYPVFENAVETVGGSILYGRGEPNDNWIAALVAIKAGTSTDTNGYGSGTEDDPFIIANSGQLRTIVQRFDSSLTGCYFKVADGIDAFVLNNSTTVDTLKSTDNSNLYTLLTGYNTQWQNGTDTNSYSYFSGHIDFNGITIYGMYNAGGGLFAYVKGECSFKNLTIAKSVITSSSYAGALVRQTTHDNNGEDKMVFDNIAVVDCYISSSHATYGPAAIVGFMGNGYSETVDGTTTWYNNLCNFNNCFVKLDSDCFITSSSTLGGIAWGGNTNNKSQSRFNNCLVLGIKPYSTWSGDWSNINSVQHAISSNYFSNVYTDQSVTGVYVNASLQDYSNGKITQISTSDVSGSAAKDTLEGFDFDNVWSYDSNGGYPTPVTQPEINTTTQYNLNLLGANIAYNNDGTFDFNFYYEPKAEKTPVLYVGQVDADSLTKLTGTVCDDALCTQLRIPSGSIKYTISNISARHLDSDFIATAVTTICGSTVYGKSEQLSVAEYADGIISNAANSDEQKAVAAALVNYGTAAKTALESTSTTVKTEIEYYTGTKTQPALLDSTQSNSESNPYIIESVDNLYWLVSTGIATDLDGDGVNCNEYFKVADNVKALVLQTSTNVENAGGVDELISLDEEGTMSWFDDPNKTQAITDVAGWGTFTFNVSNNTKGISWTQWNSSSSSSSPFRAKFDGNGATIYGFFNRSSNSIFGTIQGATFKNLNVRSSYVAGYNGAMLAHGDTGGTSYTNTYENIAISNCCLVVSTQSAKTDGIVSGSNAHQSGVMCSRTYSCHINVSNCIVNDVIAYNFVYDRADDIDNPTGQTVGDSYFYNDSGWKAQGNTLSAICGFTNNDASVIKDSIFIGVTPYRSTKMDLSNNCARAGSYKNVYTDMPAGTVTWINEGSITYTEAQIKQVDVESLSGTAATRTCDLGWGSDWIVDSRGGYPMPVQIDVEVETAGKTLYWDGTNASQTLNDNGETGTEDDPVIIDSAEELAYLVSSASVSTTAIATTTTDDEGTETTTYSPKYFKIADGIDRIVLQGESYYNDIIALDGSDKVAEYFTNGNTYTEWVGAGWNGICFCGNFDGNGAEIYGMYFKSASKNAGLFPTVEAGATISNLTLKNSYIYSSSTNYDVGFVTARSMPSGTDNTLKTNGAIVFDQVAVVSCYMDKVADGQSRTGVFAGTWNDAALIKNCLVYDIGGQYTYNSTEYAIPLYGAANNGVTWTDDMTDFVINANCACTTVKNSVILSVMPYNPNNCAWRYGAYYCYSNVYTDQTLVTTVNGTTTISTADQYATTITVADTSSLIGSAAQEVVDALNTANGEPVWYTGNEFDGLPALAETGSMPTAYQSAYDNVSLDLYSDYESGTEEFGLYLTSLNLKNNPYMSLIFSFGSEDGVNYRKNRDKIKVTYQIDGGTEVVISDGVDDIPAYDANGDGLQDYFSGVNGWTNKKGAGAYHTYVLKDLPLYDLSKEITVTVTYGDRTQTAKVSLSGFANECISSYLKSGNEKYATNAEAVKALLYYTQTLEALRAANANQ